ncbi:MAG: ATP synthase F1 subunit epsilon [Atopobiaceae bacterium]|jgi:F-type H+-transporting ATPase subunit epsilon|nr:ATP synthase F1 subunit epsilon [Atopobiaceae bacterium]
MKCQFVRPDKLLFQGEVHHLVLVAESGEIGVWPGHAPEICALGNGVVRLTLPDSDGGGVVNIIVMGGYAEVSSNSVIVLADHARREGDIEPDVVQATKEKALASRNAFPVGDHRRAYYDEKVRWCDLLLSHV